MNRMTKKRVGMVLAFSLTLTGAAAYIGIQQGNTDKTEAAGSLTAGVSASLNASEVEALDVTAGVTSQLYDKTDVAVAANEKQMVAQGIEDTQTKEAVSENTTEDTSICGYKNLGIAQVQGSLNVRKKASTDSKVVGKMTDKDACEIVSVKELEYGEGYTDSRVSLVQFALQFVGNRYVWGGTSLTNGIDCSGFTMQVYARYGVGLPHHAASQPAYGKRISASEAKPGDLFFYGSGSSISHVGIYIGNGQIVHASNARTGIKISNAYYRTPICVISYLN